MNRSRAIAVVIAFVACFGLADSGYLTIKHLQGAYVQCGDECSAVLGSKYADGVGGVPLAGFGAIAYATVLVTTVLSARGSTIGSQIQTVLACAMAIVSLWLLYLQAYVIHSFCKYCLASAAASFALAGLVLIERFRGRVSGLAA